MRTTADDSPLLRGTKFYHTKREHKHSVMTNGIVYFRPRMVARIRAYGRHRESAREAWERVFRWADKAGLRATQHPIIGFGLLHKTIAPADHQPAYDACVELVSGVVPNEAQGIMQAVIPGGAYLRTRFRGELPAMGRAFRDLRTLETKRRGLVCDTTRPLIEVYHNDPKSTSAPHRIDLCVPVKV